MNGALGISGVEKLLQGTACILPANTADLDGRTCQATDTYNRSMQ